MQRSVERGQGPLAARPESDLLVRELVADGHYAEALAVASRQAAGGSRDAQRTLAEMLFHGEPNCDPPVLRNRVEAEHWFRKAAAQGCPISRYYLDWYFGGSNEDPLTAALAWGD